MQFGKYELVERIAQGGMAEVFSARRFGAEGFVKELAIKRILPHFCEDPEFVRLFINEATLAAQLHHANIVQIHDFDAVDGIYYIAMELVPGQDLRRVLTASARQGRRLRTELGLHVVGECLKALMAAHEMADEQGAPLSIVHRDMSPHNVLVSYAGEVKLTDFGIAKAAARAPEVGSDVIRGKLPYMSPEQILGDPLDHRTDLFSLGVILFELCTGRRLWSQTAQDGLVREVAEARVPDPAGLNAEISPGLREVILTLLARSPGDRYPTARAALQALRRQGGAIDRSLELQAFMEQLYPEAAAAARRRVTTTSEEVGDAAAVYAEAREGWARPAAPAVTPVRSRVRLLLLGGAVLLASGAMAFLALEEWSRPSPRSAPAPTGAAPAVDAVAPAVRPGHVVASGRADAGPPAGSSRREPGPAAGRAPGRDRPRAVAGHTPRPGDEPRPVVPPPPPVADAAAPPPPAERPRPAGKPSPVVFTCRPWALVSLAGAGIGQTPQRRTLAPGRYRAVFKNPDLGLTDTASFTVSGDGQALTITCKF
jgi:serine/threonine-protein kinase